MNAAIVALAAGTILAVSALAFVLYPLFFDVSAARHVVSANPQPEDFAISALREIEFDRATGKLSDADYAQLKEQYTRQALASMRRSQPASLSVDDDVEVAIRAYRAQRPQCTTCGPRPERDATFCSNCGRFLPGTCTQCNRRVEEVGARYCSACGTSLAA